MTDGGGYMERDRTDLLNRTFHLSLSLSHTKTSSFFHSLQLRLSQWVLRPLFAPSGSGVESKRLCSSPHARVIRSSAFEVCQIRPTHTWIKLLQHRLGQNGAVNAHTCSPTSALLQNDGVIMCAVCYS